jgi:hypothetical protein
MAAYPIRECLHRLIGRLSRQPGNSRLDEQKPSRQASLAQLPGNFDRDESAPRVADQNWRLD